MVSTFQNLRRSIFFLTVITSASPSVGEICRYGTPEGGFGNLNWGVIPAYDTASACRHQCVSAERFQKELKNLKSKDPLTLLLRGVIKTADSELNDPLTVISEIRIQGYKRSDPDYQKSLNAIQSFPKLLHFSICARTAVPPLSEQCKKKALNGIMNWVNTYVSTGDPINENAFIKLFQAIDLMRPFQSATTVTAVEAWMKSFVYRGDQFFSGRMKGHATIHNNWNTWRLAIRGSVAQALVDARMMKDTANLIHEQARNNFVTNSKGVKDGTSVDFIERDALHYHIYGMQGWLAIQNLTPCLLNRDDHQTLELGFNFLKPYFLKNKEHLEFKNSKVAFDAERAKAGDATYQIHKWDSHSKEDETMNQFVLMLARPAFKSLRTWTQASVNPAYDPLIKFQAKLFGEPLDSNGSQK